MVINSSGDAYSVEHIRFELVEKPVKVYNFEVEDFHTYHVGKNSILVHNANNYGKSFTPEQQKLIKEGKEYARRRSISQKDALDYVRRCQKEGLNAQIHQGHMSRMNQNIPMSGVSGQPHLHIPSGSAHIPIK